MPDGQANETTSRQVTVAEVHAEFEKVLRGRTHMGVRNFLGDACLEPRNPFQAARRRPKKWVVAAACIILLALVIAGASKYGRTQQLIAVRALPTLQCTAIPT